MQLNPMFSHIVETVQTASTVGCPENGGIAEATINIAKAGYTPQMACVKNLNSDNVVLTKCLISGDYLVIRFFNPTSTRSDFTPEFYVLYM